MLCLTGAILNNYVYCSLFYVSFMDPVLKGNLAHTFNEDSFLLN